MNIGIRQKVTYRDVSPSFGESVLSENKQITQVAINSNRQWTEKGNALYL